MNKITLQQISKKNLLSSIGSSRDIQLWLFSSIRGEGNFIDYRRKNTLAIWRYLPSLNAGTIVKIDSA
ncbi:MAG: hypothetical protein QNJ54_37255 [Prochloraceae cyanobacterium]|nr:hypothetical protein [Prochloraceae cyanobacterium]